MNSKPALTYKVYEARTLPSRFLYILLLAWSAGRSSSLAAQHADTIRARRMASQSTSRQYFQRSKRGNTSVFPHTPRTQSCRRITIQHWLLLLAVITVKPNNYRFVAPHKCKSYIFGADAATWATLTPRSESSEGNRAVFPNNKYHIL